MTIDDHAFEGCTSLASISILGSSPIWLIPDDKASTEEQVSLILGKDYAVKMSNSIKYTLLWKKFVVLPDEPELLAYIKKNYNKMFQFAIDQNNMEVVTAVCNSGVFLTKRNIDKFIDYSIENTKKGGNPEIQALLTNFKSEKIGLDEKKIQF